MTDAWAEYFTGPVPPAEGGVNWEAYSHEELYQMLWQDADVADVSTVATEWAKHRVALTTHAEVLREQCAALRESWAGPSAEEAAKRLEALAARVEKIGELAAAGGQAAQDAADALAMARAMMPAPPGGAGALPAPEVAVPAAPASPSMASLQSYMDSMQSYVSSMQQSFASALPSTTSPSSAAFGAVSGGGSSFYFGAVAEDQQKAQAVRTMRTYEASLTSSSQRLGDARSAVPAVSPLPLPGAAAATTSPAQVQGGVPWQRLVGAAPRVGAVAAGPVRGAPLGPGGRLGALPGMAGSGAQAARLAETAAAAAARAAGPGAMAPVGQRGAAADDEQHENQLPTLDHGLFDLEEPTVPAVIGGQP